MTERHPLVVVRDVHKTFLHEGRPLEILKAIDLTIEAGEMLAVVGPSGAGKSTLLHILGTLDLPTSGSIRYEGQEVTRYSSARLAEFRNRSLGFVFQFHHLLPEFTALENVMMPGLIRGGSTSGFQEAARALLSEVGLAHRLQHRPGELSGGEQQRVALARALVMEPKLVLADEPTGNLDSKTSQAIHQLLLSLNATRGTTFLIVTHNRELAEAMPRQVAMRDGRIEEDVRRGPYRSAAGQSGDAGIEAAPPERVEDAPPESGEDEPSEARPATPLPSTAGAERDA